MLYQDLWRSGLHTSWLPVLLTKAGSRFGSAKKKLSNADLLAKFGFDTAENEPAKNLQILPILLALTPNAAPCGGREQKEEVRSDRREQLEEEEGRSEPGAAYQATRRRAVREIR